MTKKKKRSICSTDSWKGVAGYLSALHNSTRQLLRLCAARVLNPEAGDAGSSLYTIDVLVINELSRRRTNSRDINKPSLPSWWLYILRFHSSRRSRVRRHRRGVAIIFPMEAGSLPPWPRPRSQVLVLPPDGSRWPKTPQDACFSLSSVWNQCCVLILTFSFELSFRFVFLNISR